MKSGQGVASNLRLRVNNRVPTNAFDQRILITQYIISERLFGLIRSSLALLTMIGQKKYYQGSFPFGPLTRHLNVLARPPMVSSASAPQDLSKVHRSAERSSNGWYGERRLA